MKGLPRKTAFDEFLWELLLSEGIQESIDIIRKHHGLRTFWPMTEAIINNMREVKGCYGPEGTVVTGELEIILERRLRHLFAASTPDSPSIIAMVAFLAVYTTAFYLVEESSLPVQVPPRTVISALEALPTLLKWLRGDSIVEPMLTVRAAFLAVLGAMTQEKLSYGEVFQFQLQRSEAIQIPYFVLFRSDYPFANEYEERILLQCASIIMKSPDAETQNLAKAAVEKYGKLGVAQGVQRILSSRLPLHAIVGERVLRHFYHSPGGAGLPWLEAGVHVGIMDNLWRARRLELHSSQRVESDFPRVAYKGLLTIGLMMGGASASYEHGM
ncbi:hypothetical protein FRC01_008937, partial [Tulasnella sp. 417]